MLTSTDLQLLTYIHVWNIDKNLFFNYSLYFDLRFVTLYNVGNTMYSYGDTEIKLLLLLYWVNRQVSIAALSLSVQQVSSIATLRYKNLITMLCVAWKLEIQCTFFPYISQIAEVFLVSNPRRFFLGTQCQMTMHVSFFSVQKQTLGKTQG